MRLDNPRAIQANLENVYFSGTCADVNAVLDNLYFSFDGKNYYTLTPESYLFDSTDSDSGFPICIIGIVNAEFDLYLLGDLFLRSYYAVMDYSKKQVGIAPSVKSKAYITTLDSVLPTWAIVLIVIGCIIVVVAIIIFVVKIL